MVTGSQMPLGTSVRGPSAWILWQTARDSLQSRLRQLELDPHVHRDVVRHLRGTLADLELAAWQYRDWESARSAADSAEPSWGRARCRVGPSSWVGGHRVGGRESGLFGALGYHLVPYGQARGNQARSGLDD
jgi:hypothetical protein